MLLHVQQRFTKKALSYGFDASQLHAHIAELAQLCVDGSGERMRVAFTPAVV